MSTPFCFIPLLIQNNVLTTQTQKEDDKNQSLMCPFPVLPPYNGYKNKALKQNQKQQSPHLLL